MPMPLPFAGTHLSPACVLIPTDNVDEVNYDGGYYDSQPRSLFQPDMWEITYNRLREDKSKIVIDALRAVGTWDYFTWTPTFEAVEKKFRVVANSKRIAHDSHHRIITFQLIQRP